MSEKEVEKKVLFTEEVRERIGCETFENELDKMCENTCPAIEVLQFFIQRRFDVHVIVLMVTDLDWLHVALSLDADVNMTDFNGRTPLMAAVEDGELEVAEALLRRGAEVDARDSADSTSLMYASYQGCLEMIRLLLRYDADPALTNRKGRTALKMAEAGKRHDVVSFLEELNESQQGGVSLEVSGALAVA